LKNEKVEMPTHALLAKARHEGNPIIDGKRVTFIWQGKVAPSLIDDLHNWEEDPQSMERVGPGLWAYSMDLSNEAYLEYAFLDLSTGLRVLDPLNQNCTWNGFNSYNHYFYMPGSKPTSLVLRKKGNPQGKVTQHQVLTNDFIVGKKRTVYLYQPPSEKPVPLVVVYDGVDYLKRAKINVMVDNLIAANRMRPIAMALIQNGGQARSLEYSCSESMLEFLVDCLLPLAQKNLHLQNPDSTQYGVLGASMGGLMAMYTGFRLPDLFGKVISQSGVFIQQDHQLVLLDLIRYAPRPDIDIWMDAGQYEWLLECNRQMYTLLKNKKFDVDFHEFSGGHNYIAWRNDLWFGFEALFGSRNQALQRPSR
jgi:enterochelin esterase-like enzyme